MDNTGDDHMRREAPLSVEIFLSWFPHFRRHGASLHLQYDGCVAGGVPAGCRWRLQRGGGVTDDSQIVRLSDRVMAGRQLMTDQGRREETGGEEGSLAAIWLSVWGDMGGGYSRQNKSRSAQVAAAYPEGDQEAPILIDNGFTRDQRMKFAKTGSTELVSSRCFSLISEVVCSRCESSHPGQT